MQYSTRKEAKQRGEKLYFTGKPCVNGHVSLRRTDSGVCTECRREKESEYSSRYYRKNRETIKRKVKEYTCANKATVSEYQKSYREKNKQTLNSYLREYQRVNRVSLREKQKVYQAEKRKNCDKYRISKVMRQMVVRVLRMSGKSKNERTTCILGYGPEDLIAHIENLFRDGMSWSNYGDWHIDHVRSISSYIESGVVDPRVINALSNLQPLWASDNCSKGA